MNLWSDHPFNSLCIVYILNLSPQSLMKGELYLLLTDFT